MSKTQKGVHTYDSGDLPFIDDFNNWPIEVLVGNPEDLATRIIPCLRRSKASSASVKVNNGVSGLFEFLGMSKESRWHPS